LWNSELDGRGIDILGTLPNLMLLNLDGRAYVGNELAFKKHEFPNLKELRISMLSELRGIRFEKDALPHMERMEIECCELRSGIVGIKHLQKIKEISLGDSCKVAGLDLLEEEVKAHPNKPALQLHEDRSTINLGSPVVLTEDQGSSDEGKAKESVHDDAGESSGK
jgi:disease resistance protein RPM1